MAAKVIFFGNIPFRGIRKKYKQVLYYYIANINIYIYSHGVSRPLKKPTCIQFPIE